VENLKQTTIYEPRIIIVLLFLIKLLLIIIGIPILVFFFPDGWNTGHWPDGYDRLAQNMLQGHGFRFHPNTADTMLRMPGYPLVLMVIFTIFGKSIVAVQVFNIVCSTIAAFIAMHITISLSKSNLAGSFTAIVTMLYPAVLISDGRGGPESLYMLALVSTVALLYKAVFSKRLIYYVYFGLSLGMTLLIKSTIAFLPLTLLVFLVFYLKKPRKVGKAIISLGMASVTTALVLTPWIVRNYSLTSEFVPATSITGVAAFQGLHINKQSSLSKYLGTNLSEAKMQQNLIANDLDLGNIPRGILQHFFTTKDELIFSDYLINHTYSEYIESPTLLMKGIIGNSLGFWFRGKSLNSTLLNIFVVLPLIVISIHGCFIAFQNKYRIALLLLVIMTVYVPHIFLIGLARYHVPITPLLAILSSFSLSYYLNKSFRDKHILTSNNSHLIVKELPVTNTIHDSQS
jgi:4-amino-4-deoxy-L-arabinose transferase-like glycosyltransferase